MSVSMSYNDLWLAVDPVDVEVEAGGGVADDLVDVAHGEVVVTNVAESGAG